jgi:YggT family protein
MMVVHLILQLLIYIIIFDVIMSYIPELRKYGWAQRLHQIADALQRPIREALPQHMPLDPSPMIVIIIINILLYLL